MNTVVISMEHTVWVLSLHSCNRNLDRSNMREARIGPQFQGILIHHGGMRMWQRLLVSLKIKKRGLCLRPERDRTVPVTHLCQPCQSHGLCNLPKQPPSQRNRVFPALDPWKHFTSKVENTKLLSTLKPL